MKRPVPTPPPPAPRSRARTIGVVIVLVGLIIAAWWIASRRATDEPPISTSDRVASADASAVDSTPAAAAERAPASSPPAKGRNDELRRRFQRALGHSLYGVEVADPQTRDLLSEFRIPEAIARTQALAASGSTSALILLSEMSEHCAWRNWDGAKRTRTQTGVNETEIRASAAKLPAALRENIEAALDVNRQWTDAWLDACADARLDRGEIAQQLRAKADTGDEVSLRRLAEVSTTPEEDRLKLLQSAAVLGDQDALVGIAATYYREVTEKNDRTHVKEMQYWLNAASKSSPYGQYMLGHCRLKGCDGQPPDIEGGLALLRAAARRGDGFALKELADVIPGGTGSFTNEEQYAWLIFERELRDRGCSDPLNYAYGRIDNWRRIQTVGQSLSPYALPKAEALGEQFWRDYGSNVDRCD